MMLLFSITVASTGRTGCDDKDDRDDASFVRRLSVTALWDRCSLNDDLWSSSARIHAPTDVFGF